MEKNEKLEALYLVMLSYANYAYDNIEKRCDRIYSIISELSKQSKKFKPILGLNKNRTVHWFNYFRDLEIERIGDDDDYSPELLAIYLLQYLTAEYNYRNLQVKYSNIELLNIMEELELAHKKLFRKALYLVDMYLDSSTYIENR